VDFCPYVASASYILEACSALVLYHSKWMLWGMTHNLNKLWKGCRRLWQ
jgi:hypothetical protein